MLDVVSPTVDGTRSRPDREGFFGTFGGRFVPEALGSPLEALEAEYAAAMADASFRAELERLLARYAGRPTSVFHARRLSMEAGAEIYLKREDLLHTGGHCLNNCLGQALLARRMGKRRLIAETGAGQHGVAAAAVAVRLGLDCTVFMGAEDMRRQRMNVLRMRAMGARVVEVAIGSADLKEATGEAMRAWAADVRDAHYLAGSAVGPHPYPRMVRDFQKVIGQEARRQILAQAGTLPRAVFACVGGGSNAIGLFDAFVDDREVRLIGAEAGGQGAADGQHGARLSGGTPGVLHGTFSYLLQDAAGQVLPARSVAAGLGHAIVGPEHAWLDAVGRADYVRITDGEAVEAARRLSRVEGIIPALESAHAVAAALQYAAHEPGGVILVSLSGRGDKDIDILRGHLPEIDR
jgi:tryptophan synthase beta chain